MEPLLVAYGGGINSTAMLVGMHERGIRPDAILFADTGGERPETYAYVAKVSAWCESVGFPGVVTVHHGGKYGTLEGECLAVPTLPSIAYGFKRCSLKWKLDPQEKWANHWQLAKDAVESGHKYVKAIGYHAGETHRQSRVEFDKYTVRYLLREWRWFQEDCVAAVKRAGLEAAHKSACFFCPSTKPHEILDLKARHPDLMERALRIEDTALATGGLYSVKGLGRNWSWRQLVEYEDRKQPLPFCTTGTDLPCGCYDGGDDD